MKMALAAFVVAQMAFAGASVATAADFSASREPDGNGGVKIGYLDCEIGSGLGYGLGSAKTVDCVFKSSTGSRLSENYSGTIRKLGVDVGFTTRGRLVWAVFAPTAGYHEGSLSGLYEGATAEATVGAGVGANILVGGTAGSIQLQTLSVTGQIGLNLAAAGTSMTLNSVN